MLDNTIGLPGNPGFRVRLKVPEAVGTAGDPLVLTLESVNAFVPATVPARMVMRIIPSDPGFTWIPAIEVLWSASSIVNPGMDTVKRLCAVIASVIMLPYWSLMTEVTTSTTVVPSATSELRFDGVVLNVTVP